MKLLELTIGKLTVIERVNWTWLLFFVSLTTYCVIRQFPTVWYQWGKLIFINKLFGFKSGCSRKMYWGNKRLFAIKIEDFFAIYVLIAALVMGQLLVTISHSAEFGNLTKQVLTEITYLTFDAAQLVLYAMGVATLAIGSFKRVKR